MFDVSDDEDEVLVSLEQQDTRELTTPGGRDMHAIGFTITKVTSIKAVNFDFKKFLRPKLLVIRNFENSAGNLISNLNLRIR